MNRLLAMAARLLPAGLVPALVPALAALGLVPAAAHAQASVTVQVTNARPQTIYVAFTNYTTQAPGPIDWGNCAGYVQNNQAALPANTTCTTTVAVSTQPLSSRFCASTSAMNPPNCNLAQTTHQTLVETTFGSAASGNCAPSSLASCVWYDISVIPQNCTDTLWQSQTYCSNTGGAAYNLPVALSCGSQPKFACQGPTGSTYGNSGYPTNCGTPTATCVGGSASCVLGYFYPMFDPPENRYQPVGQCPAGSVLTVTFLAGP
jgi:hypothetical protein